MNNKVYSEKEEFVNAITHGLGALLAVVALVVLIMFSVIYGSTGHVISFSVYGATLVTLYLASTLYHSFKDPDIKTLFRKFDHIAIFLLIAGTYTPFCINVLSGWLGWVLLCVVWVATLAGIVLKILYTGKKQKLSTFIYIALGWVAVPVFNELYNAMSGTGFTFLLAGGIFYTAGTFFFINNKIPYNHGIWHLFVLAGSLSHFFSVMSLL